ncbi:hypothetical protein MAR_004298 [Mya arenaria]|uniref:Ribosomal protein L33 n=1 Tax=Mya arenaria TaxID=6604 RepID=A0ABY7EW68_MYAAR|nr:hypothetical protein MAR_004298 [Mya arenaria]
MPFSVPSKNSDINHVVKNMTYFLYKVKSNNKKKCFSVSLNKGYPDKPYRHSSTQLRGTWRL